MEEKFKRMSNGEEAKRKSYVSVSILKWDANEWMQMIVSWNGNAKDKEGEVSGVFSQKK